jgi:hypothetical protein
LTKKVQLFAHNLIDQVLEMLLNSRERLPVARETDQLDLPRLPELPETGAPAPARDLQAVGFVRDFMTGLTEPAMIPAFLAGGMAYRALRWGAAGQWVASPAVKTISGLLGRQLAASTVALGGEVVAFTGAQHGARAVFNLPAQHPTTLGNEMTGTAIMLGSLRSFGFGGHLLGGALQRAGLSGAGTRFALSQASSYAGLLTAQQIEHRLLHPDQAPIENPYLNAAVSLIHFTGFNLMARNITPRTWQLMEHHLEQKTQKLFSEKLQQIRDGLGATHEAEALVWNNAAPIKSPHELNLLINFSKPNSSSPSGQAPAQLTPEQRALENHLWQHLNVPSQQLSEALAQSRLLGTPQFDLALRRLYHVARHTPKQGAHGSYINWITRLGFERILGRGDAAAVDRMMELITQATSRPEYEAFISQFFPEGRLPPPPPPSGRVNWELFKRKNPHLKGIDVLPLSDAAKTTLRRWIATQANTPSYAPLFIPADKFLHLLQYLKKMKDLPKWKMAETALERAGSSPMGLLKIHRLYQILHSEMEYDTSLRGYAPRGFLGTKLRELVDDQFRMASAVPEAPREQTNFAYGAMGGHLGEHGPAELLRPMLSQLPDLLDPAKITERREKRQRILGQFLKEHPDHQAYSQENLAQAFRRLHQNFRGENTPLEIAGERGDFSFHIARDLENHNIRVEALPRGAYQARYHEIKRTLAERSGFSYKETPVDHTAYYFDFGEQVKLPGLTKPTILLEVNHQSFASPRLRTDLYFEDMTHLVHEWMHTVQSRRFKQGQAPAWTESAQLKQEAATHTAADWFGAQHGNPGELVTLTTEGLGGYMMRFLDHYEGIYKKFWRPS